MLRRAARAVTTALGDLLEGLGTGISRGDLIDQIIRLRTEVTGLQSDRAFLMRERNGLLLRLEGIDSPDAFEQGLFCDFCDVPSRDVKLRVSVRGNDVYQCDACAARYPTTKGE